MIGDPAGPVSFIISDIGNRLMFSHPGLSAHIIILLTQPGLVSAGDTR
jgi:hypothetical protein